MTNRRSIPWQDIARLARGDLGHLVDGMSFPVRCTRCGTVYDLGKVQVIGRYTDCSVWKCPGCKITVDDRPPGWGDHHYVELDQRGHPKGGRRFLAGEYEIGSEEG